MINIKEIAQILNGNIVGRDDLILNKVVSIDYEEPGGIAFILRQGDLKKVPHSKADVIVGPDELRAVTFKPLIITNSVDIDKINTVLALFRHQTLLHLPDSPDYNLKGVTVGKGVCIGEDCFIAPGVHIGNNVKIGNRVAVNANTVIKDNTTIGDNVTIDSNCSIGNNSFEYFTDAQGNYERMISMGRLIIEDNVDIGCNCTIDRGTLGTTRIGKGTKIDNLVQIGHDVTIGTDCIIVSQVGISGWSELGNNVILHGQVGVAGGLHIGDRTIANGQAGITRSWPAGSKLSGYPARDSKTFLRSISKLSKL